MVPAAGVALAPSASPPRRLRGCWTAAWKVPAVPCRLARRSRLAVAASTAAAAAAPPLEKVKGSAAVRNEAPTGLDSTKHAVGVAATEAVPQFDWFQQWYPVRVVEDLDPSIPHAVRLLGLDLVLWRDRERVWRCFEDRCPHRLAALSEGRIDEKSGDLFCNYHGWQFDGAGQCTRIPQLSTKEQQQGPQKKVRSPRACAVSYPTRAAEGLLWVWASAGPGAQAEADAAGWKGVAGALDGEGGFLSNRRWFFREIPTGFTAMRENVFNDPSHDDVLHHGALPGFDRSKAAPMGTKLREMTPHGYVIEVDYPAGAMVDTTVFPCGCTRQDQGHGAMPNLSAQTLGVAYMTPAAANSTLYFSAIVRTSAEPARPFLAMLKNPLAALSSSLTDRRWLAHLRTHTVLDADVAVLHSVNRNRAKAGGSPKLYLPAESDRGPATYGAWMERYGGGGPRVSTLQRPIDLSRPEVPRQVLLDRFEKHTRHCRSCSGAHAAFSLLASTTQLLALVLAAAALSCLAVQGSAACLAVQGGTAAVQGSTAVLGALLLGAAAAGATAAHLALRRLVQRFVFVDFDQSHVSKRL